jgi:hypothetical protein
VVVVEDGSEGGREEGELLGPSPHWLSELTIEECIGREGEREGEREGGREGGRGCAYTLLIRR